LRIDVFRIDSLRFDQVPDGRRQVNSRRIKPSKDIQEQIDSFSRGQFGGIDDDRVIIEATKTARSVFDLFPAYFDTESNQCVKKDILNISFEHMTRQLRKFESVTASTAATAAFATSATAATATAATVEIAARRLWTSLINSNGSTVELGSVQPVDGCKRLIIIRHFHETKAFGPASVAIRNYLCRIYFAVALEGSFQLVIGHVVANIAYIDVHFLSRLLMPWISITVMDCPGCCDMAGYYHFFKIMAPFCKKSFLKI
jgi:hypothetical protein